MNAIGSAGKNILPKKNKIAVVSETEILIRLQQKSLLKFKNNNYGKVHADLPGWWTFTKCFTRIYAGSNGKMDGLDRKT
jgi:hypothetical protein